MSDLNLLDNRPLARAGIWFLVDAGIVLAVLCGVMAHRAGAISEDFHHPGLWSVGLIAMTALFSLLAVTSSVLGFLSNCRPGRTVGTIAIVFLFAGLGLIVSLSMLAGAPPS